MVPSSVVSGGVGFVDFHMTSTCSELELTLRRKAAWSRVTSVPELSQENSGIFSNRWMIVVRNCRKNEGHSNSLINQITVSINRTR